MYTDSLLDIYCGFFNIVSWQRPWITFALSVDLVTLNLFVKSDSKFFYFWCRLVEMLKCIKKPPHRVLAKENMAQFEVAQIANLCCEDAEEAKALIPR